MAEKGGWTGLYAAWISSNGRSYFDKPRKLYDTDWDSSDFWDKGGNNSVDSRIAENETFSPVAEWGGFAYVNSDPEKVRLVIEACGMVLESIAKSWGLKK